MFVRRAEPTDLDQLAGFDEWRQATEEPIRAGECFVAGHDADVLAYDYITAIGGRNAVSGARNRGACPGQS